MITWTRLSQSLTKFSKGRPLPFGTKQGNTSKHNRFTCLRRINAVERGSTCRLNPTWYLVTQHFGLRGRQENYNSRNEHFKFAFANNENGCTYVTFVDSNSTKMRIFPIKLQGGMVIPRMVASSGEKCVQLTFLKNLSAADQAKAMKVHGLKILKT